MDYIIDLEAVCITKDASLDRSVRILQSAFVRLTCIGRCTLNADNPYLSVHPDLALDSQLHRVIAT